MSITNPDEHLQESFFAKPITGEDMLECNVPVSFLKYFTDIQNHCEVLLKTRLSVVFELKVPVLKSVENEINLKWLIYF